MVYLRGDAIDNNIFNRVSLLIYLNSVIPSGQGGIGAYSVGDGFSCEHVNAQMPYGAFKGDNTEKPIQFYYV
jgi:hypothetical protein